MNRFKVEVAIDRLQNANRMSHKYYNKPIVVAYSGGKDSQVVAHLAERALGSDFCLLYNHTGIDYPEVVKEIKAYFEECKKKGIQTKISYPDTSMFKIIIKQMFPPTLIYRTCCHELKERNESNIFLCTGVRWAESSKRKAFRDVYEAQSKNNMREAIKLSNDNDAERELFETCRLKATRCVNPIVDWSDDDVWDYIKQNGIHASKLYEHFERVGCIGCPMAKREEREKQFALYPGYKRAYLNCFKIMLERLYQKHPSRKKEPGAWQTPEDVFEWWMNLGKMKKKTKFDEYIEGESRKQLETSSDGK